jgi:hypothetical protein
VATTHPSASSTHSQATTAPVSATESSRRKTSGGGAHAWRRRGYASNGIQSAIAMVVRSAGRQEHQMDYRELRLGWRGRDSGGFRFSARSWRPISCWRSRSLNESDVRLSGGQLRLPILGRPPNCRPADSAHREQAILEQCPARARPSSREPPGGLTARGTSNAPVPRSRGQARDASAGASTRFAGSKRSACGSWRDLIESETVAPAQPADEFG